jgi:alkylhydroperoxidase family enzyme
VVRIRPLSIGEAAASVRPLMERAARVFGEPLVPSGIQAYCPPILEASQALGAAPARSHTLPAELRSLVCLRVAELAGCPF